MSETRPSLRPQAQTQVRAPERPNPREYVYEPSGGLPDPTPQPGWRFAWKRLSVYEHQDVNNMHKLMREGWTPCKKADHPELSAISSFTVFRNDAPISDEIVLGGLILMKIPEERARAAERYFEDVTAQQLRGVESQYKQHAKPDERMPLSQDMSSDIGFGSGKAP